MPPSSARTVSPGCGPVQLQFRCLQSPSGPGRAQPCPAEPDLKLTAFLGLPAPVLWARCSPPADRAASAACPACDVVTTKAGVPGMPQRPARRLRQHGGRFIALVGPKTSGKSTYITVLVRELHERVGECFGAAVNAMDDRTGSQIRNSARRAVQGGPPAPDDPAFGARPDLSPAVQGHHSRAGACSARDRCPARWSSSIPPGKIWKAPRAPPGTCPTWRRRTGSS